MSSLIFHPEMDGTKIKRFLMNAFAKPTQIYSKPIQTRNSSLGVSMISAEVEGWERGRKSKKLNSCVLSIAPFLVPRSTCAWVRSEISKLFSHSSQLSLKFQLLMDSPML